MANTVQIMGLGGSLRAASTSRTALEFALQATMVFIVGLLAITDRRHGKLTRQAARSTPNGGAAALLTLKADHVA